MNCTVVEQALTAVTNQKIVENGMVDHAKYGPAIFYKCDHRAKEMAMSNKALGPVNRIQYPLIGCFGLVIAKFLAQDAMVRKGAHNRFAHRFLGLGICNRDRRKIRLDIDLK